MIILKPQDTLLALKYWSLRLSGQQQVVRDLAESIGMSASEVSKGAKRLIASRLLVEREGVLYAESGALLEWLSFGVRFAFPVQEGGFGRGIGTAWNCSLIKSEMVVPSPGFVWAVSGGKQEGVIVAPFYSSVPLAASRDELLYKAAALVDVIRMGKPRELKIARGLLGNLITGKGDM